MTIIDTHQHLWERTRLPYSWTKGIPRLDRCFSADEYLAEAAKIDNAKIVAAVHVEADVDDPHSDDETSWVLSVAEDAIHPTTALVAACRPENDRAFDQFLERFACNPRVSGVRRVLHTQPDGLSQQTVFRTNLAKLPRHDLTFDLVVQARQLPVAIELVRKCPDVQFVLDHCGVPDIKGRVLDPWRTYVAEIARHPNVVACKISGVVAYADPASWTEQDLRPYVDHVVRCFGHDRIMFGSDWPVCTLSASLAQWVATALLLTCEWSPDDRSKLFASNARRVYRLHELL